MVSYVDAPAPLSGYWWEDDDMVVLALVASNGHPREFLAFLKSLEGKGKRVFLPTVINRRLEELLKRRGYVYNPAVVFDEKVKEWVDGYIKE